MKQSDFIEKALTYILTIGLLVGGYMYNVKFIQLGIPYLGEQILHFSAAELSKNMALLAILTSIIALFWCLKIDKLNLTLKQRFDGIIIIGTIQMVLTICAGYMTNPSFFLPWIILTSIVLGFGIPLSFPLVFELIPTKERGIVAGLIAGIGYLIGNLSPFPWTIHGLMQESLLIMIPGLLVIGILRISGLMAKFMPNFYPSKNTTSNMISDKDYEGRFNIRPLIPIVLLMFMIFFIDSLGFLRIIEDSTLISRAWYGNFQQRAVLGVVHFIAAIAAGWLYSKTNEWVLGLITLVGFGIADLIFAQYNPNLSTPIVLTIASLYCATVSVYTVINFAIWADISTKFNAGKHAGIGIAIGGWLSSFLSTSLVYYLIESVDFHTHLLIPGILSIISILSIVFFISVRFIMKKKQK